MHFFLGALRVKPSSWCHVTDSVWWSYLAVLSAGLRCVIMVFSDHTHLRFWSKDSKSQLILNYTYRILPSYARSAFLALRLCIDPVSTVSIAHFGDQTISKRL